MPYEVSWLVQDYVVLVKAIGDIQDDDLIPLDHELIRLMDSVSTPRVHAIADLSEQTAHPSMKAFSKLNSPKHSRIGWFVACGDRDRVHVMINTFIGQLFRIRVRNVKTRRDAIRFLAEVDAIVAEKLAAVEQHD